MNTHTKDELALNIEEAIKEILRIEKVLNKIELDIPTKTTLLAREHLHQAIQELYNAQDLVNQSPS